MTLWKVRCLLCSQERVTQVVNLVTGRSKACSSCAKKKLINEPLARRLAERGHTWDYISKRVKGISLAGLKSRVGAKGRGSWIKIHGEEVRGLVDKNLTWKQIKRVTNYPGTGVGLISAYQWWIQERMVKLIDKWVESPHGKVVKALAEGRNYDIAIGGARFKYLTNEPLPPYINIMLNIDTRRVATMIDKGASWRLINELLDKPCRWGAELAAVYHASLEWHININKKEAA